MLLNLSNHPSVNWSKEQRAAAEQQFGSVADLAFPQIDPTATTADVKKMAAYYAREIAATPHIAAVHLMGEMTFIVALTRKLQRKGIVVLCSTTNRIVLEEIDGKKTMQFQFVQFREYSK